MDLVKLNNEISGMRPAARQSKVHVIHHLTRKAEGFRKRYGLDDKKTEYQRKSEKYMQEALIDKDLVLDEIIKFSLQFDSTLRDKVLNDVSIPLSTKAFARIAAHTFMVKAVNEFREKYPDWDKWLEKSLEKLGTGSRFGAKMKNGRVKAHLQQRQRVEEAVDTIRRAQMSWLHQSGKNKIKVKSEEKEKGTERTKVESDEKTEEINGAESSESHGADEKKSQIQIKSKHTSENTVSDDDCESENSAAKPLSKIIRSPNIDSKNSVKAGVVNSKDNKNVKPVVYEEVDENYSSSEGESENQDEQEQESVISKKKLNRAEINEDDSASDDNESADESQSEDPPDQSDSSSGNESEESTDGSESLKKSLMDEKRAKKLLKKEKKKLKVVIPRSREVEVCKFSDLLKKDVTKKSEDVSSESEDERPEAPEKGVDPFFMTRDNDLLRIATARRETKQEEPARTGPKWGIEGSEEWSGTRSERRARARRMMGIPDPEGFSRRRGPPKFNPPPFPRQRENTRESWPLPPARNVSPDLPEELHPSWAAKRKMKIASVGFQGKKVKFDDSD